MKHLQKVLIIFLSAYFLFFTFYNLNWGAPFYFHPDERNIASAIAQLNLTSNMNPHFYAYGQLPIYTVYFLGVVQNLFNTLTFSPGVGFEQAMVIGRVISAILTVALVVLIYKSALKLKTKETAILAFIFGSTSVAFFQFSHFSTFEIWLSFLYLAASFVFLLFLINKKILYFAAGAVIFGITCGLKLSSLAFIIVPLYVLVVAVREEKKLKARITTLMRLFLILIIFSAGSYFLTSPFNLFDSPSFINSMKYESSVANGSLPVFYTGSFINQIPIVFQFQKILPFSINPILTLIAVPSLIYASYIAIKTKDKFLGIFLLAFASLFLSGSLLYAKWTRYIIPSIPFLYILIAYFVSSIVKNKKIFNLSLIFFALSGLVFSFSYLVTVRIAPDTRLAALDFALKNVNRESKITSEVYDLGIVPFNPNYKSIELFNFYDLDNGTVQQQLLPLTLDSSDYLILPSQRIYESRTSHAENFPVGGIFYQDLFSGKLGFEKIYETPCDLFCKITYQLNPVFNTELTSNVFDRPTVYIFKKTIK